TTVANIAKRPRTRRNTGGAFCRINWQSHWRTPARRWLTWADELLSRVRMGIVCPLHTPVIRYNQEQSDPAEWLTIVPRGAIESLLTADVIAIKSIYYYLIYNNESTSKENLHTYTAL